MVIGLLDSLILFEENFLDGRKIVSDKYTVLVGVIRAFVTRIAEPLLISLNFIKLSKKIINDGNWRVLEANNLKIRELK